MLRTFLLAAFGLVLLAALVAPWLLTPGGGDPVAPPRKWGREYNVKECRGTLAALTPTSFTLAESTDIFPPYGPAPTRFALGPALVAGTYLLDPAGGFDRTNSLQFDSYTYRVRDLRLGDKLEIFYMTVNGVEVCDEIRIERRYTGRVPPVPGRPRTYLRTEYHNVVSHYSECELKGLTWPYPPVPELPPDERDPNAKPSAQ